MTYAKYELERLGQEDFFKMISPRMGRDFNIKDILEDNHDGCYLGSLYEFKLNITDVNAVLFQAIKYCLKRRIIGKEIPKNLILIDINKEEAYVFDSKEYLEEIEKVYTFSSSINNEGFKIKSSYKKFNYRNNLEFENLIKLLKEDEYTKINIDENCILGWAERYYRENPRGGKDDFLNDNNSLFTKISEIRQPFYFKRYINPYIGEDNIRFRYLMDKLNDKFLQKNLGAFYTPKLYVKLGTELVREAIKRVPKGNDYVIIDRCCGTGNLLEFLTDEELSHCIVSTYEYYEYKVLLELYGYKVRHIIPPRETSSTFNNGLVNEANALSEEFVGNTIITQYIDNPNCNIIMFENLPYAETTSIEHQKKW